MPTLTVLLGVPGAGKTTWTGANPQPGRVVCSTERLRIDRTLTARQGGVVRYLAGLRTRADRALRAGHDVLVDGCNTRKADRTMWLRIANNTNAQTHLVVFDTPLPLALQAQKGRAHPVPDDKIRAYHSEYLAAVKAIRHEGWDRITYVRRTNNGETATSNETSVRVVDGNAQPKRVSKW